MNASILARHLRQDGKTLWTAPRQPPAATEPPVGSVGETRFYVPYPRPAIKRTIHKPGNVANNSDLLATQTRVSSGATYTAPPRPSPTRDDWWGNQRWADEEIANLQPRDVA